MNIRSFRRISSLLNTLLLVGGKIIRDVLESTDNVEYLAIVISGVSDYLEGKMIKVEEIMDGTGQTNVGMNTSLDKQ